MPQNRIIDLSIPILGKPAPNLTKIQQDGLIMQNAKTTITLGDGGNLWLAAATGNVIGYRDDDDSSADLILNPNFTHVKMFKRPSQWPLFIKELDNLL